MAELLFFLFLRMLVRGEPRQPGEHVVAIDHKYLWQLKFWVAGRPFQAYGPYSLCGTAGLQPDLTV